MVEIGNREIGAGEPVYIIAEIGSNFDGNLDRAFRLIYLAKDAGADSVKFQSFKMEEIISPIGFIKSKSFQSKWKKNVGDIYKDAELPRDWHKEISDYCKHVNIDFSSSPYDFEAVDILDELNVPYIKVGSGDITYLQILEYIAKKGKPIILSTGASTIDEINDAVYTICNHHPNHIKDGDSYYKNLILLQCVTNYPSPFEDANIKAMQHLKERFKFEVGYSDHTPGSIVPLGAVALGACVIEKHFTDDIMRTGPDHPYAMTSESFKQMVKSIRILEKALGKPEKKVYPSEKDTRILQRRCLRASRDIKIGELIKDEDIVILRPCPENALQPEEKILLLGTKIKKNIWKGEPFEKSN